ncbi:MAG: Demethylspheroidene O-methyltransferase [Candidatus Accumulibacter phosphatis]|jgi:SAM-dependent methyltransferase|uniref:Demethylspheroidene O-methyltransferase n=1 Tax=Candidatus Accumulibacter phosphatis TaxID=327160 RepID=A0A080LVS7_9PROT|nr:methyltransferase [Accumulibacter sp.]KFB72736.1 MAG: Demethylspheroidene O-methyltransferase [Candidatus Accumulibacter phosphatis]HCZ17311.1 methyltransferase [Accumulibacter sp.]
MAISHEPGPQSALARLWGKHVALPVTRFFEGFLLRRQVERLYLVFGGHIFFQTLRTAVQLDLFTLLAQEGPLTRQEIAKRLGIAEQPARIMVLGLTVTGLLRKSGAKYSNTYVSKLLLDKNSPRKITAYVELQHRAMYKGLYWMLEAVREYKNVGLKEFAGDEPTLYQRLAHDPEVELIFQEAMQELSVQANADLARFIDMKGVKHLVDVGGGDGTNIIAIARRWPHLRATVFDSPTVCEIARKNIAASGLANRLDAVPGECFADAFPRDADCLMFAHFFTIWSEKQDRELFKKCYDSLPPGGQVVIFNMMQHDDESGPFSAAVGSPYFLTLATGAGMLYTWNEYETWMRDAGFHDVRRHRLLRDHGLIVGRKP